MVIKALFLLALGLFKTLLERLGRPDPLRQFRAHYEAEGILAVTAFQAKTLSEAGRCTACGLCDRGEGTRVANSQVGYRGMMAFALGACRSLPDYDVAANMIREVPENAFREAEAICPERVPLLELARLVRDQRRPSR